MIIYWCAFSEFDTISQFKFYEPTPVSNTIVESYKQLSGGHDFRTCPALRGYFKNVFELKFPCDYTLNFSLEEKTVGTSDYDQKFFDEMVLVRSLEHNLYAYNIRYLFFTESDLEVSQEHAYFSDTEFSRDTMFCPGKFNISKWFRALDCGFIVRSGVNHLAMKEHQPYSYVRFNTDEKVIFKRFYRTDKIKSLQRELHGLRSYRSRRVDQLLHFYEIFRKLKIKSLILKEIKENLMD